MWLGISRILWLYHKLTYGSIYLTYGCFIFSVLNGDSQPHVPMSSTKIENLFISVESVEELALLTNLRDELRSSPMLRSLLLAKLDSKTG